MSVWLERFSGHSSSPAPRRSIQLSGSTLPRRPGPSPRTSSLSVASIGASADSLPAATRIPNGVNLKDELGVAPAVHVPNPVDVLESILGPLSSTEDVETDGVLEEEVKRPQQLAEGIDFGVISLEDFANAHPTSKATGDVVAVDIPVIADLERDEDELEGLHRSISACDEMLGSVETYLTSFRADIAAVSSEIEHLQDRSLQLNKKLENRKAVEKVLGPEIEAFAIPPHVVRKITEGTVDDAWVRALESFEKLTKVVESKKKGGKDVKIAEDMQPFISDVSIKAVERIRDYVVAQIKALRSPTINAQIVQRNAFLRYRNVFGFLADRQAQLAEGISQAYTNTMRWYYGSNFARYKTSLDNLNLYIVDQGDVIAVNPAAKRTAKPGQAHDAFSLGRRAEVLRSSDDGAISSFAAEEDKGTHYLEMPFRAFNLALVDNVSSEYSFLTEFFMNQSFQATNRKFSEIFAPTFQLGQEMTKQLISGTMDALGVLVCLRLTQEFAFELQRRKCPGAEGYVNGTNMLLWPRFQQVVDAHGESIRKLTASLPGKPAGSALSLTSSPAKSQTTAPHPLTQRSANFFQGILSLSSEAGDEEPIGHSLGRLRNDFEAFLIKMSKEIAEARKRERFLYNNYSLICTVIADTEGRMANELREHFEGLRDGLKVDG